MEHPAAVGWGRVEDVAQGWTGLGLCQKGQDAVVCRRQVPGHRPHSALDASGTFSSTAVRHFVRKLHAATMPRNCNRVPELNYLRPVTSAHQSFRQTCWGWSHERQVFVNLKLNLAFLEFWPDFEYPGMKRYNPKMSCLLFVSSCQWSKLGLVYVSSTVQEPCNSK